MFKIFRNPKVFTAFFYDAMVALFSFLIAVCLRFETFDLSRIPIENLFLVTVIVFGTQAFCFSIAGLYKGIWRFSSTHDLIRVVKGSVFGVFISIVAVFLFNRLETVPRSAFVIDWLLLVMGLGGGRFAYRIWKDTNFTIVKDTIKRNNNQKVLIVGAGVAGNQIVKDIFRSPALGLDIVGFIDDDPGLAGRLLNNIKVLGPSEKIAHYVEKLGVKKVFIAIPSATGEQIKSIVHQCEKSKVEFKILPKISQMLSDRVSVSLLRNVKFEDLLGRKPVELELDSLFQLIEGETVLVTGAGGSIGSELCRQLTRFSPSKIIFLDISEYFLYQLEKEFEEDFSQTEIIPIVADVRDEERIRNIFSIYKPDLILHAAAYKHVPMMEKNPAEAIKTNVLGTSIVTKAAIDMKVKKFVMISTDKAVNPTNVMGASKRIAEMVCRSRFEENQETQFITVRFGNVLGSNGSVIPLFRKYIEEGKDVPVTHPDMERYFMSIPEACQLVLQATTMGSGGEIFVLDMGEPVKILDLAKEMINLAGLKLGNDINIKIIGLRPGEKLYEELFSDKENLLNTDHEKVRVAQSRGLENNFPELLNSLISNSYNSDFEKINTEIKKIVPEFIPDSESGDTTKSLN
ncbi:MAG: polysaccharide biosynthesis protein [Halobacteriovorax sp.]|nr:polysaccharide biosynthesis protein [Halobacteriovorax sp.]